MKKMIAASLFSLIALPAFAQTVPVDANAAKEVLSCVVAPQSGQPQVMMSMMVSAESNGDFVLINVVDKNQTFRLFTQVEKGEITDGIAKGTVGMLVLEETFNQDAGVIRNAGFVAVSKDQSGAFGGIVSARGNIYPVTCTVR